MFSVKKPVLEEPPSLVARVQVVLGVTARVTVETGLPPVPLGHLLLATNLAVWKAFRKTKRQYDRATSKVKLSKTVREPATGERRAANWQLLSRCVAQRPVCCDNQKDCAVLLFRHAKVRA